MKTIYKQTKGRVAHGLDCRVTRLVVKQLESVLKKQGAKSFKQMKRICRKIRRHEELLDIVARQVAKQAKSGE